MTANKQTVETYMDGFRQGDHAQILACLTDDVEWLIPGAFQARGKDEFDAQVENEGFVGRPDIRVSRLIEEAGVVVAEGTVRTETKDGAILDLVFCDVFEMHDTKIRRLVSYLMAIKP